MWPSLTNNVRAWDVLHKVIKEGSNIYLLCRKGADTTTNILRDCIFSKQIWRDMGHQMGVNNTWTKEILEECLKSWYERSNSKCFKIIPYLVARWGVWTTQNMMLFEYIYIPTFYVTAQVYASFNK